MSARRSRICIVNPYEHGGGAEFQIEMLIDVLGRSNAYEIHYLTHFVDPRERPRRYAVHQIGRAGPIPTLGYAMEARSLYGILRDLAPDIIYQRVACAYTGVCAWYARRHGIPMLWHVAHDTEVTRQSLDKGRNIARLRLEKWGAGYGATRATRIVVQTRHQADLLQQNYCRAADAVLPNFHPAAHEAIDKSGPLTVLWVANLKPWKQPEVFVRLAERFSTRQDIRFVMVGAAAGASGNRRWQNALMESIQRLPHLQYVGHKSHAEVNQLLAGAHLFVNTSIHEGFPNTFIQAWLRDVVVISLQVDPDHVLERKAVGIMAHTEDALFAAVSGLAADPGQRLAYALRGREHAAANHSLRNAEQLVRLLNSYRRPAGELP